MTGGSSNGGDGGVSVQPTSTTPGGNGNNGGGVNGGGGGGGGGSGNPTVVTVGGGTGTFPTSSTPTAPIVPSSGSGGGTITVPTECVTYIRKYIRFGEQNDPVEVDKLQGFLRYIEGFENVQITGVYDAATFEAVKAFQERYKADILDPWGLTEPTGYVYITTVKKINEIFCGRQFPLTPAQQLVVQNGKNLLELLRNQGAPSGTVHKFEGGLGGVPSSTERNLAELPGSLRNATGTKNASGTLSSLAILTNATSSSSTEPVGGLAFAFSVIPWGWIWPLLLLLILLFVLLGYLRDRRRTRVITPENAKKAENIEYVERAEDGSPPSTL